MLEKPVPAWTFPEVPPEPTIPFDYEWIFRGPRFGVVDKPHFLPSTANGRIQRETVQTRLRRREGEHVTVLHRLDRLTAGLLLCSTDPLTRSRYQSLFARREVNKTYVARVQGRVSFDETWRTVELPMKKARRGAVEVAVDGRPTITRVRALDENIVEMQPITGHTHQLRVLMAHMGTPIVGDDTYPIQRETKLYDYSQPLYLVAQELAFTDPVTSERHNFCSQRRLPIGWASSRNEESR